MDFLARMCLKEGPPTGQIVLDLLALILLCVLVPLVIWVTEEPQEIPHDIPYVVAGVTVVATLLTALVKGRVQHGLMRELEADLRNISLSPEPEPASRRSIFGIPCWKGSLRSRQDLLDIRWRGVLAIDTFLDKLSYNLRFFILYLLCALLTAAIVTAFTPNTGSKSVSYQALVPGPLYSLNFTRESDACAGQGPGGDSSPDGIYRWDLRNGSYFFSRYRRDCPASRVVSHVYNINIESPDKYAYVDAGVAVDRTAMGASAHLFRGSAFQKLTDKYGRFLKSTTQCVPVMTTNPVTCTKGGGKLERGSDDRTLVFTPDEEDLDPRGYRPVTFSARNLSESSAMINYLYADDRNNTVGPGVIVFSAYNDPDGVTTFAKDLARTINDPDKDAGTGGSETYVVMCRINPLDSFEYRLVTLSLQATGEGNSTEMAYSRRLIGNEACIPKRETVSNLHFVAATSSQYRMGMENYGLDGYFSTVHRLAGEDRKPPYAFNNSRNGLEDALGVIAALGVSNMDLGDDRVVADAVDSKAEAEIEIQLVGGNRVILISLIPALVSIATLLWFFGRSFSPNRRPGGGVVHGKCPELYAAESIGEIMTLGTPVSERLHLVEQQPLIR